MNERIKAVFDEGIVRACINEKKKTSSHSAKKIDIKPFKKNGEIMYQFIEYIGKQVFHSNFTSDDAAEKAYELLQNDFNQMVVYGVKCDRHITHYNRLKIKITKTHECSECGTGKLDELTHNGRKNYIIPEGEPCDFLIELGVMNAEGKVLAAKYDKFRQINKYLETVAGCIGQLKTDKPLRIVDFGCGKAYLTFALYHYIVNVLKLKTVMTGLDLKDDVINFCNRTAQRLGYDGLTFENGDIRSFENSEDIDMVITLHACDTATDEAIVQAISWRTKIILTVPCCQHELFNKIKNPSMELMTKHGIIKERLSSLITDSIRGALLESCGYSVQISEFISLEHTPKNILIKAVKKHGKSVAAYKKYREFAAMWNVSPYLEKRLSEIGALPKIEEK